MQRFYDLEAWKLARELKNEVARIAKRFPTEERYALISQIIRSSRSVTANISEGYGRNNYKETIHFCRIARGSLEETLNHLIDAFDEEYITNEELKILKEKVDVCLKVLNGYIGYLRKNQKNKGKKDDDDL
ncbi:four helix bundle protein [Arcicella aurantiaca]|uniref:Four helix bundle protein n=1 Tax=Arcicella aurantiaca TaxID=591202 RepID=A0A316DFZ3_9BACT|nr:four helix bundle protein [Arcicella aurantiaca]PWK16835.1 four helix bundle protein [Arcicella aurantiaca]